MRHDLAECRRNFADGPAIGQLRPVFHDEPVSSASLSRQRVCGGEQVIPRVAQTTAHPSGEKHLAEPVLLFREQARSSAHALMQFLELSSGIAGCGAVRPQVRTMLFRA